MKRCLTGPVKGVGRIVNDRVRKILIRRNEKKKHKMEEEAKTGGTAQQQPPQQKPMTGPDNTKSRSSEEEINPTEEKLNEAVNIDQDNDNKKTNESSIREEL